MKTLEICSGENASFTRVAMELGYETLTLDCNPRCAADVCEDIRTWDYKAYPPDYFAVVWASPPCDQMSICNSSKPGLETADEVTCKILEICEYFTAYAFVENPYSALPRRPHMSEFRDSLRVVNYCTYSEDGDVFPYAKKTAVYDLSQSPWIPRPLCDRKCAFCENGVHVSWARHGPTMAQRVQCDRLGIPHTFTTAELHRVPKALCREILQSLTIRFVNPENSISL